MIIGICGLIGSGKGSVADILVENHNFEKLSFADKLKDGVLVFLIGIEICSKAIQIAVEYGEKKKMSFGQMKQVCL